MRVEAAAKAEVVRAVVMIATGAPVGMARAIARPWEADRVHVHPAPVEVQAAVPVALEGVRTVAVPEGINEEVLAHHSAALPAKK
jgi:hypothetical protein